jgi:hypothetical protein
MHAAASCAQDFGLLEGGVFGSTPEAIAALHTPALDVRLIAFTVAAGVLGDKLPDVINIHKTRYITGEGETHPDRSLHAHQSLLTYVAACPGFAAAHMHAAGSRQRAGEVLPCCHTTACMYTV